jgi:PST family polysaccharide transporter
MESDAVNEATVPDTSSNELSSSGIKSTAWIVLQTLTQNLASLVVFIVLGRLLDPDAFGLVAAASVVVLFFRILVDAGISKNLIQREDVSPDLVNTAFWSAFAVGTVLTGIMVAAAPLVSLLFREPRLTNIVRALSCILLFASLDRTQSALLDRRMAFRVQAARNITAAVVSAGAAIGAAVAGWGVWALVVQSVSFELVTLVLLWTLSGWYPSWRFAPRHLPELLSFGGRYMGIQVLQYSNLNSDNLLIGAFLGPVALGLYVVAYRVLIVLNEVMAVTVSRVGLAAFSRLRREDRDFGESIYRVAGISGAIALPIYAGLAVIAPEVVHLVFGLKWARAAAVMQILCVAGIAQTLVAFTHPLLIALDKVRNELRWNVVATVVQLAGFGAAIHFGIVAVAWSLAVSSLLFVPIRILLLRRWVGTSVRSYVSTLTGPCLATAVMAGVVAFIGRALPNAVLFERVLEKIAAGVVVYIVCLLVFDRKTVKLLTRVARTIRA